MQCYKQLLTLAFVISVSFMTQQSALASITLGGTRFVYGASDDSLSINVKNRDKNPYLVQSWISVYTPPGQASKKSASVKNDTVKKIPFIVTPPLFKIEADESYVLNIVKTDSLPLPQDRESVFYLNVKAIPGKVKDKKSSLMISVDSSMKLFYRPSSLEGALADAAGQQLTYKQSGSNLVVNNPTAYFVTLYSLAINGVKIKMPVNSMLDPFGNMSFPAPGSVHTLTWQTLGDQGQISQAKTVSL